MKMITLNSECVRVWALACVAMCLTCLAMPATAVAVTPEATATMAATTSQAGGIVYRVRNETLHRIDARLFGQFMERPSWGETGPEGALVPGTSELQPAVLKLLRQMQIPIVRFPGGTDVDYLDWTDMISNAPGRAASRPVSTGHKHDKITNNFGYDEFLRFCQDGKSQPILVVNFRDGLLKKKPLAVAAAHAAALVAYCNSPAGAKLPDGMADWPAVRAANGHAAPYGVKYWQIGNETWAFNKDVKLIAPQEPDEYWADCLVAYARAMLAVDPSIEFIVDGHAATFKAVQLARKQLGGKIAWTVFHSYTPWAIKSVTRDGQPVPAEQLTAQDIWNAWVAVPGFDSDGLATLANPLLAAARKDGFKVAVTEWNWNGWWSLPQGGKVALASDYAKGVGAAGFVHALMRAGDVIDIGCQSMLVGHVWGITAIHADPKGVAAPYYMPSGQVTMMYSQHHGDRLLAMDAAGVDSYVQPFTMGGIAPRPKVAYLDALATADDKCVYFHVINRHFEKSAEVTLDLAAFADLAGPARHYLLQGRLNDRPAPGQPTQAADITTTEIPLDGKVLKVLLPERSVSCIEIPRMGQGR